MFQQKTSLPSKSLGHDFHIYELLWTPTEISLSIDGIKYGSLGTNLRESAIVAKIKSAINWSSNGPFDKEVKCNFFRDLFFQHAFLSRLGIVKLIHDFCLIFQHFIAINLAAGSVKNFSSFNSSILNGEAMEPKPWNDTGEKH